MVQKFPEVSGKCSEGLSIAHSKQASPFFPHHLSKESTSLCTLYYRLTRLLASRRW